ELPTLVVSKVANFSIDLPEAAVAIQISGTFGSRQEEAQRLGRVMRPKADGRMAHFYAVVTRDTVDQEFAAHRQRFLAEQGYAYSILDAEDLAQSGARSAVPAERGPAAQPRRNPRTVSRSTAATRSAVNSSSGAIRARIPSRSRRTQEASRSAERSARTWPDA